MKESIDDLKRPERVVAWQEEKIAQLQSEQEECESEWRRRWDVAMANHKKSKAQIAKLEAALREYGQHFDTCEKAWRGYLDCVCGLSEILLTTVHPAPKARRSK